MVADCVARVCCLSHVSILLRFVLNHELRIEEDIFASAAAAAIMTRFALRYGLWISNGGLRYWLKQTAPYQVQLR